MLVVARTSFGLYGSMVYTYLLNVSRLVPRHSMWYGVQASIGEDVWRLCFARCGPVCSQHIMRPLVAARSESYACQWHNCTGLDVVLVLTHLPHGHLVPYPPNVREFGMLRLIRHFESRYHSHSWIFVWYTSIVKAKSRPNCVPSFQTRS